MNTTRISRFFLLSLLSILIFGAAAPTFAIINGTPDTDETYPYVVLLGFVTANYNRWDCTGTLLSPTVILTAGHCTAGTTEARAWLQADMRGSAEFPFGGPTAHEGHAVTIPGYARRSWNNQMDVGLVILNEPVYLERYGQIASAGLLSSLSRRQLHNTDFTVVGYGDMQMENKVNTEAPVSHLRSSAIMHYVQSSSNGVPEYSLGLSNSNGQGATCYGDSGGPIFYGNTNQIVALVATGRNINCGGEDLAYRVDTHLTIDWVTPFLR